MEIEIPVAENDTGTEEGTYRSDQKMEIDIPSIDGDPDTVRTETDKTISEAWSCEAQASFFTSRSLATSRDSRPLSSTVQKHRTEGHTGGQAEGRKNGEMEDQTERQSENQAEASENRVGETNSRIANGDNEVGSDSNTKRDENLDVVTPKSSVAIEPESDDMSYTEDTDRSTRLAAEEAAGRYLETVRTNSPNTEDADETGTREHTGREVTDRGADLQQDTPTTGPEEAAGVGLTNTDQNDEEPAEASDEAAVGEEFAEVDTANGEATEDGTGCAANLTDQEKPSDEKSPLKDTNSTTADNDNEKELSGACDKTPEQDADVEGLADAKGHQDEGGDASADGAAKPEAEENDGIFLTESAPGPELQEEGSDISGARADTPDWDEEEEEGAENDAASLSDLGGISQRIDPLSARSRPRPLTSTSELEGVAPGQRGVVNTPVSYFTNGDYTSDLHRNSESRNASRLGVESAREAAFQRAMTLMTSRCDSKQERVDTARLHSGRQDGRYGPQCPQYFYVDQARPSPMAPLKAWRGYGGNIYFQPMHIQQMGSAKGSNQEAEEATHPSQKPPASKVSCKSAGSRLTRTSTTVSRSQALVPVDSGGSVVSSREGIRPMNRGATHTTLRRGPTSAKSKASSRSVGAISQHLVLYLDKQAVTRPGNSAMHEELDVIERQQSMGSLNLQQGTAGPGKASRSGARSAKFNRICRGSVAHHLRRAKSGGPLGPSMNNRTVSQEKQQQQQQSPSFGARGRGMVGELMVVGDKFCPPTVMSPLLRAQTQFSLSSQRMTVNTPDIYATFERLPPLEQMRVSLRHMDSAQSGRANTPYSAGGGSGFSGRVNTAYSSGGNMGVVEDLKPFIKYSPDVKAQYNRQLKFCC